MLAKELASVDVVSGGRLIFGLGAGYLKAEFDALGVSFEQQGRAHRRGDRGAAHAVDAGPKPSFRGEFWSFSGIQAHAACRCRSRTRRSSSAATARAPSAAPSRQGNGWYGFALDLERTRECVEGLEQARAEVERPASLGPLEIGVTPRACRSIATRVRRYEDLGVERLVPIARGRTADELVAFVE